MLSGKIENGKNVVIEGEEGAEENEETGERKIKLKRNENKKSIIK